MSVEKITSSQSSIQEILDTIDTTDFTKIVGQSNKMVEEILGANFETDNNIQTPTSDLPLPSIDVSDAMLLLAKLGNEVIAERIKGSKEEIKMNRQEMRKIHQERMKELAKYYDKMKEADSNSKGFFGRIFNVFKKVFKGDIKGAMDELGKLVTHHPFKTLLLTVCVIGSICLLPTPMGFIGLAATAFLFAPEVFSEPEVVKCFAKLFHTDEDTAQKWCMSISITISIAETVAIVAATTIVGAVATEGMGTAAAFALGMSLAGVALAQGGMELESGILQYQATEATSEAMKHSSAADKLQATYQGVQEALKRNMNDVKTIMESLSGQIDKTIGVILAQGRTEMTASTQV